MVLGIGIEVSIFAGIGIEVWHAQSIEVLHRETQLVHFSSFCGSTVLCSESDGHIGVE